MNKKTASKPQEKDRTQQLRNSDEQLWRQVKAAAVMEGTSMTDWVEEAIRMRLAETKKKKAE